MKIAVMLLVFIRGIAGATFFLNYEAKNQTLICKASSHPGGTAWWFGDHSTQKFKMSKGAVSTCPTEQQGGDPCYTEGKELNSAFPHGQIVACKSHEKNKTSGPPIFTNKEDCREFDFFILAKMNRTEQKRLQVKGKNFSLPCEFQLQENVANFAVYWLKETDQTTCLHSVSNEDHHDIRSFSYNINCCVDANMENRTLSDSKIIDSEGRHQNHELTIVDVIPSDTGIYLCVLTMFAKPQNWRIVTNMSVEVEDPSSSTVLKVSLGIVGGVVLISGIGLLFYCKNRKATASEQHQRDYTIAEREVDDCTPYAICSRNVIDGNQAIYSLVMKPGVNSNIASSLPDDKPAYGT
nr:uncharacterized protein LOC110074559 [Pogona vitticeps]